MFNLMIRHFSATLKIEKTNESYAIINMEKGTASTVPFSTAPLKTVTVDIFKSKRSKPIAC